MTTEIRIPTQRKLLYLGVIVALALVAGECGLRVRQWIRFGSPATGVRSQMLTYDPAADLYVPKPGYEAKGARIHVKINSLGFRGNEFTREKPSNTIRIVAMGASTTFCAEVSSNERTWPHRLQEKLQAAYPSVRVEVINAAVAGYTSTENLKNLQSRVLPLDPDLVIYYEANNEIVHDTRELAVRQGLLAPDAGAQSSFVTTLSSYSLLFDLVHKNLAIMTRGRSAPGRTIDQVPADLTAHFIGALDQMRAMLAKKNAPLVLSTFLSKYRRGQDRQTQIANADVAFYYMPWMSIDGMLNAMDVYNQAILDDAAREHSPVVDDREAIPADARHYADCMHLLDDGAEAMADRFYRHFKEARLLDGIVSRAHKAP